MKFQIKVPDHFGKDHAHLEEGKTTVPSVACHVQSARRFQYLLFPQAIARPMRKGVEGPNVVILELVTSKPTLGEKLVWLDKVFGR